MTVDDRCAFVEEGSSMRVCVGEESLLRVRRRSKCFEERG